MEHDVVLHNSLNGIHLAGVQICTIMVTHLHLSKTTTRLQDTSCVSLFIVYLTLKAD